MSKRDGRPWQRRNVGNEHGQRTSDGMHAKPHDASRDDFRTYGGRLEEGFAAMNGCYSGMGPGDYMDEDGDE